MNCQNFDLTAAFWFFLWPTQNQGSREIKTVRTAMITTRTFEVLRKARNDEQGIPWHRWEKEHIHELNTYFLSQTHQSVLLCTGSSDRLLQRSSAHLSSKIVTLKSVSKGPLRFYISKMKYPLGLLPKNDFHYQAISCQTLGLYLLKVAKFLLTKFLICKQWSWRSENVSVHPQV